MTQDESLPSTLDQGGIQIIVDFQVVVVNMLRCHHGTVHYNMVIILLRDGLQLPYRLQRQLVHIRSLQFLQHDAVCGTLHAQVAIILGVVEDAQIEWFQT